MKFLLETPDPVTVLGQQVSLMWIVIGAALVIFMQAGFALVETGMTQAKNAAHVVSTNFAIFGLGFIGFYLVGFAFSFGGFSYSAFGMDAPVGSALLGSGDWIFLWKGGWALSGSAITPAVVGFFLYMVAFMDTVATIPTGSMAERWKWNSFVLWGFFCGAIYYPIIAAWTWGGGWLAKTWSSMSLGAGYVDFAGSGVVHAVGGVAAFTGAIVLGPRIGKFGADGKPRTIAGHHVPMAMLGTFILLFGWFGFNAGSALGANGDAVIAFANTNIASATSMITWVFYDRFMNKKISAVGACIGAIVGLVAITPAAGFVTIGHSAFIGFCAAIISNITISIMKKSVIDDALDVFATHGVGGIVGMLLTSVFANEVGLIYGNYQTFILHLIALILVLIFVSIGSYAIYYFVDLLLPLRVREDQELRGLDLSQHGENI